MSDPRIISLIASATEIVCALGAEKWLVGISHECDYPESVLSRSRCTSSSISSEQPSGEIDAQVRSTMESGQSLYRVDVKRIKSLEPTVIFTQVQCEVCAVSPRDLEGIGIETWAIRPQIVPLNTSSFRDLYNDILRVARPLRIEGRAFELCDKFRDRIKVLQDRTNKFPKRKVACLEWLDPLMISGNWMPELVQYVGGRAVLADENGRSRTITIEELQASDPDVIVCMPCGFSLDRTIQDIELLANDQRWNQLRAVQAGRAYAVDGNTYFNRPGPRLVDSAELMAQLLHPSVFDFPNFDSAYKPIAPPITSTPN
ncbi:MAG: cobalamin-binding protein [bacterium]|nr:cobalamin-binding protein [bacterium]